MARVVPAKLPSFSSTAACSSWLKTRPVARTSTVSTVGSSLSITCISVAGSPDDGLLGGGVPLPPPHQSKCSSNTSGAPCAPRNVSIAGRTRGWYETKSVPRAFEHHAMLANEKVLADADAGSRELTPWTIRTM